MKMTKKKLQTVRAVSILLTRLTWYSSLLFEYHRVMENASNDRKAIVARRFLTDSVLKLAYSEFVAKAMKPIAVSYTHLTLPTKA